MTGDLFVDTNVLVYARDAGERKKGAIARAWIEGLWKSGRGRLSFQVLSEYYVTVTVKLDPGLPEEDARGDVRDLLAWRPVVLERSVLEGAFDLLDRFSISWWDSLIVAAAHKSGSEILLTEDLQDGQEFDGVTVVDPFTHPPDEFL